MLNQDELAFLVEILQKRHVKSFLIKQSEWDDPQASLPEETLPLRAYGRTLRLSHQKLYKFSDAFHRNYCLLLLPSEENDTVFFIGPFLREQFTENQLLELAERKELPLQKQSLLEYYRGLPVLTEQSDILMTLDVFCQRLWDTPSFPIVDLTETAAPSDAPFTRSMLNLEPNDTLINKQTVETRYAFENELIRAVSLGQSHVESQFKTAFSNEFLEKRADSPLRNAKNYGIIMNTLLRKAAEQGGVHPVYINQVSSEFALQIEKLSTPSGVADLMNNMFRTYCRLVRKHAIRKYPLVVQKTILIIDADLSADLSPKKLALSQDVTLGYLSSVFKKATGKTISEYILYRRIEYAEYLLRNTNLQVQTIALHCGVLDAQYFSKQFKKVKGVTPLQFRHSATAD